MTAAVLDDILDLVHVNGSGEYFYSPDITDADAHWVEQHPAAVEAVVSSRRTPFGFYTKLPVVIEQFLRNARMLSIDLETTSLTRFAPPITMTNKSQIGQESWRSYRAQFPEATINTQPRMRVLAIHAIGKYVAESFAFDLDLVSAQDRQRLIDVIIDDKVIVGHNVIGFDLFWLLEQTTKRPKRVFDTLILTRQCKPEILTYLNYDAARGDEERAATAIETLTGKSQTRASLDFIATCLGLPKLSKEYQSPQNWCVSHLSAKHHAYVMDDIATPLEILQHIFGTTDPDQITVKIGTEFPWYFRFETAGIIMSTRPGVPFNEEGAARLEAELTVELKDIAQQFACDEWNDQFPEDVRAILADPKAGLSSKAVVEAMVAHATNFGLTLPLTEKGNVSLGSKEMKFAGLDKTLPCWKAWEKLAKLKKQIGLIATYREYAKTDGRLHSLISWITAMGRTSSSEPNIQAMPRDSKLRALVAASEFHELVWADFSMIELRIASRVADRAIARIRRTLKQTSDTCELDWFHRMCRAGLYGEWEYPPEKRPDSFSGDDDEYRKTRPGMLIAYFASRVLRRREQALACIFRRTLDAHLATALSMARKAGFIEIEGDVIEWLASRTEAEQAELKTRFKEQRTGAKATNFGLCYGMGPETLHRYGITQYGLTWTLEEATDAHRLWFAQYPEIGLLQLYTKYACSRKLPPNAVMLWSKYTGTVDRSKYGARQYESTTLAGRPIVALDQITQVLAGVGQGSGVDILLELICSLPPHLLDALRLPVHDELLLEAPAEKAAEYQRDLEELMAAAASRILGPTMPVEVEGQHRKEWGK